MEWFATMMSRPNTDPLSREHISDVISMLTRNHKRPDSESIFFVRMKYLDSLFSERIKRSIHQTNDLSVIIAFFFINFS